MTYPLGLLYRQVVKEGYRSYEAVNFSATFKIHPYLEQPIYVFLLEIGLILSGNSPDGLVLWGRSMGFVCSVLTLILIYKISKMVFGDTAAIFSAFFYTLSPLAALVGLGIQRETLMWLFGLCAIYYILKFLESDENKFIIFNLIFSILAILTKITGMYFLFTSIAILILFYPEIPRITITIKRRILILFIFIVCVCFLSVLFVLYFGAGDALQHTIVFQPEALLDMDFWETTRDNAMIHIPNATAILGLIGGFFSVLSHRKEVIAVSIWSVFTGMEFIFYGYGTSIHTYYILYFLHPLVIFAGYTVYLIYNANLSYVISSGRLPIRIVSPLLMGLLFISSAFFPIWKIYGESIFIKKNQQFYENIRSAGLLLNELDIEGSEIAIIFWRKTFDWWRFHLTLSRTYVAKPGIKVIYKDNITEFMFSLEYKAIIAWTDDLSQSRHILNQTFNNNNAKFSGNYLSVPAFSRHLPSIEVWYSI